MDYRAFYVKWVDVLAFLPNLASRTRTSFINNFETKWGRLKYLYLAWSFHLTWLLRKAFALTNTRSYLFRNNISLALQTKCSVALRVRDVETVSPRMMRSVEVAKYSLVTEREYSG